MPPTASRRPGRGRGLDRDQPPGRDAAAPARDAIWTTEARGAMTEAMSTLPTHRRRFVMPPAPGLAA
jgi:hypothetical protein